MKAEKTIVSLVKSQDPTTAPIEAVHLLEQNGAYSPPRGGVVFIKPNIVAPVPYAVNPSEMTDPSLVAALVRYFLDHGAQKVLVGEIPAWGASCQDAYAASGLDQAVLAAGGEMCDLDQEPGVWVKVDGHVYDEMFFPRAIIEADHLINVPTLKTHFYTEVTAGIKNLFGCLRYKERKKFHRDADLFYVLADALKATSPELTVIDGITAMEGFGPHGGTSVNFGMTIAATDAVAADTVAAYLIGLEPTETAILQITNRLGLGTNNFDEIMVVGDSMIENRRQFNKPVFQYINPNENVSIYGGGICIGCKPRIPVLPYPCDPSKKYAVIVGREPLPLRSDLEFDEIWMVGNCGIRAGMAYMLRKSFHGGFRNGPPRIVKVPGCPTLDWISQRTVFAPLREKGYMH